MLIFFLDMKYLLELNFNASSVFLDWFEIGNETKKILLTLQKYFHSKSKFFCKSIELGFFIQAD